MDIEAFKGHCFKQCKDESLDLAKRQIYSKMYSLIHYAYELPTVEDIAQKLEKWATNCDNASGQLMPPYCADMAQKSGWYREMLDVLTQSEKTST